MPSSSKTRRLSFMATGELVSKAFSLVRCEDTCTCPHFQPGSEYVTAHLHACISTSAHLPRLYDTRLKCVQYVAIAPANTRLKMVCSMWL
jgi:hypothetical protein